MSNMMIPDSHIQLVRQAGVATLSTLSADESIQSSLVWFDYQDDEFTINIVDGSAKAKNLVRQPNATLLIMDLRNVDRYLSVRCRVSRFEKDGAIVHLDMLTKRNTGQDRWYGDAVPDDPEEAAHRVVVGLEPVRVYSAE